MKRIGIVTVGRSDFGIYKPLLRAIKKDSKLSLHIVAGGMHLSPEFGKTVTLIEEEGFTVDGKIEFLLSSDTPEGIAKSIGLGITAFSQFYAVNDLDLVMLLGDRFEMFAAGVAAIPFNIPIGHIHGGEVSEGAIDESFRHSLTKMSHLHFVSTKTHAARVIQMGEEPWRVKVSGAPSLDNLRSIEYLTFSQINKLFGLKSPRSYLLVTFHPVTHEFKQTEKYMKQLIRAIDDCRMQVIFTMANADTGGRIINSMIQEFCEKQPKAVFVKNLGTDYYFSLMKYAAAMVGNSSSGIIEAASFELPVVNIGTRQAGREKASNVIDVSQSYNGIKQGIELAISDHFHNKIMGMANPYGDGRASEKIVSVLRDIQLNDKIIRKKFHDVPAQLLNESKFSSVAEREKK